MIVELVDKLLDKHTYPEIAELLNQQGYRPGGSARRGRGDARFTALKVAYLVHRYGLRSRYDRLRDRGMLSKTGSGCAPQHPRNHPRQDGPNMDSSPGTPTMRTIICTRFPNRARRASNAVDGIVSSIEPPPSRWQRNQNHQPKLKEV